MSLSVNIDCCCQAVDVGGSMFVHVFGAYFGLSVATVLSRAGTEKAADKEGSVYHSDLFSVIGRPRPSTTAVDNRLFAVLLVFAVLRACTLVYLASNIHHV